METTVTANPLSTPMRATLLMLAAMLAFSCMSAFVRLAAEQLHSFEVAFFRNALALLMLLPLIANRGTAIMRSPRMDLHLLRAGLGAVAMMSFFTAITLIPLAETTVLGFASPFFATIAAILFLGERIRAHRTIALALGFVGVMVVLRPGFVEISTGAALMLLSALIIGITAVLVKKLSATDQPEAIAIWMVALQTPITLLAAFFFWEWPSVETWGWLICLAAAGCIGHLCWTRAMSIAEVSQLQPLEFAKLPFIAIIGFVGFSEVPSQWVWLGGALIFAANAFLTRREASLARRNESEAVSHKSRPPPV